jgi:hypothetical protein
MNSFSPLTADREIIKVPKGFDVFYESLSAPQGYGRAVINSVSGVTGTGPSWTGWQDGIEGEFDGFYACVPLSSGRYVLSWKFRSNQVFSQQDTNYAQMVAICNL